MRRPLNHVYLLAGLVWVTAAAGCGSDERVAGADAQMADAASPDAPSLDAGLDGATGNGDGEAGDEDGEAGDEDASPPPEPIVVQQRATELGVLAVGEGFDLNGDGLPDNALGALFENPDVAGLLGGDPNGFLAKEIADGDLNLLFNFVSLHHLVDDPEVGLELTLGQAAPGGGYDIHCDSLDEQGEPLSRFDVGAITGGEFESGVGQFRFALSFAGDTELTFRDARLRGTLSPDGSTLTNARLGGVLLLAELQEVLENDPEVGGDFVQLIMIYLQTVADLDTDGDDTPDAMSAGFFLAGAATQINAASACVD